MKHFNLFHLFAFVTFVLLIQCDILPDKNDDCEKNNWKEPVEALIYPRFVLYENNIDAGHSLQGAQKIMISGNIQRILCSGEAGFSTTFSKTFTENVAVYVMLYLDGEITKFYFQNDKDHLNVIWRVKVTFNDGKIFESDEMIQNIFYKDLNYNGTSIYKSYLVYLDDVDWYEVSN